jgi:hypothetical protein
MAARGHHAAVRIDQDATPNVALGQTKAGIATVILCHPTTQLLG